MLSHDRQHSNSPATSSLVSYPLFPEQSSRSLRSFADSYAKLDCPPPFGSCVEGLVMLVIVSDLHLNDGTTGALLDAGAAELLTDRVCDLAYRACWRADGSYQPIQ